MKLKKKAVKIGDEEFEVREISIGEVMPILPRLEIPEEQQEAQMDIMRLCITQGGEALGDEVLNLGISAYLKLAEEVMSINGLANVGKD